MRNWFQTLFVLCAASLHPCTDFVIESADGTQINGRSMEFGLDMKSALISHPRAEQRFTRGPSGKKTLKWTSKYGYVAADGLGLDTAIDGLNETGLSLGTLLFPGAEYISVSTQNEQGAMDYLDLGGWILGNFASTAEVKEALKGVRVWGHPVTSAKIVFPIHLAIHDAQGNHLVVEFLQGEMKIYDNPNSVLTNYPPFEWQIINLRNYINLTALNAAPVDLKGTVLGGTGQGSGLFGIPGDWTPPSRFVRMTTFIRFSQQASDRAAGINLADHLLNTVDIPIGVIRDRDKDGSHEDYTQWVLIKDLTNKTIYFRSYGDLSLKAIDLNKLDLNPGAARKKIRIDVDEGIPDLSKQMN